MPTRPTWADRFVAGQPTVFAERPPLGLQFTERMRGRFVTGPHDGQPIELLLTIRSDDLPRLLGRPCHKARFVGSALCPILSPEPLLVTDGCFNLFEVDRGRVERRTMRYRGTMVSAQGERYTFVGHKEIANRPGFALWSDVTTLFLHVTAVGRAPLGWAVLTISSEDFLRQLRTLRVLGAEGPAERLDALLDFGRFFAGVLLDTYGRLFARARLVTPDAPAEPSPPRPGPTPRCERVTTDDGVRLRLVRLANPRGLPVVLSPGFGMSSRCFWLDTVGRNLAEYLHAHNYDVWCLDYRASPDVEAPPAYTIDDVARRDYPRAVNAVLAATGASQVQVVVHCVGSLAFLMSALDGRLDGKIRSAVCSQLGLHPIAPIINESKAGLHLASLVRWARVRAITADYDERRWSHWLVDKLLRLYPTAERCNNPVCRRILFLFGESYRHYHLSTDTHDNAIRRLFGTTSVRALGHLALMLRRREAVDRFGEDAYLSRVESHPERLWFPIAFLHGEKNQEFLPASTAKTREWLRERNPRAYELSRRQIIRGYGHLDCFIGRQADRDVFPKILSRLKYPLAPDPV